MIRKPRPPRPPASLLLRRLESMEICFSPEPSPTSWHPSLAEAPSQSAASNGPSTKPWPRAHARIRSVAPSAFDVEAMYRPDMVASGSLPLPLTDRPLEAATVSSRHRAACPLCSQHGSLHPDYYMASMVHCLTHGWAPPQSTCRQQGAIFGSLSREPSLGCHVLRFVSSQLSTLRAASVVDFANPTIRTLTPHLLDPLSVVICPSDRARTRLDINLSSQAALDAAADGQKSISSSTISVEHPRAYPSQYSSIDDLAAFIEPGWWLATADVEAYYHWFPLALPWSFLFGFLWGLTYFFYCVVPFGFGPAAGPAAGPVTGPRSSIAGCATLTSLHRYTWTTGQPVASPGTPLSIASTPSKTSSSPAVSSSTRPRTPSANASSSSGSCSTPSRSRWRKLLFYALTTPRSRTSTPH